MTRPLLCTTAMIQEPVHELKGQMYEKCYCVGVHDGFIPDLLKALKTCYTCHT